MEIVRKLRFSVEQMCQWGVSYTNMYTLRRLYVNKFLKKNTSTYGKLFKEEQKLAPCAPSQL